MTVNILLNYYTALQKITSANSIIWQSAYDLHPLVKCLAIEKNEQNIYFSIRSNPIVIIKSDTSTGVINSAIKM